MTFHVTELVCIISLKLQFLNIFIVILLLGDSSKVIGYGHLGDGNLHLNISTPQYDDMVISFSILQKVAYVIHGLILI